MKHFATTRGIYVIHTDKLRKIKFEDLPLNAKKSISSKQGTYIDEFTFYVESPSGLIVAYYGGDILAIFDGTWRW